KSLPAHELLAKTYLKLGDARQAFNTLRIIEQLAPNDLDNVAQVASFYLLGRQREEAEKRVERILKENPDHPQALYLKAGLLSGNRDNLDEIEEIYSRILSLDPNQARAHLALSRIFMTRNQPEKAEIELKKALAISPENTNIYKGLFEFYMSRNNPDAARSVLEDLINTKPEQADPYIFLGNYHMGMGDLDKARTAFEKAVEKAPSNLNAHMLLARVFNAQGDAEKAEAYIKKALAASPDNYTVKNAYAEFHFSHGEFDKALALVEEILSQRPNFPSAKVLKGKILSRKRDYEGAVRLFSELIKEEPDSPAYHFLLGSALFEKGEIARAKSSLSTVLDNDPGHTQARILMATIHFRQGDLYLAEDNVKKVLATRPDHYNANLLMGNVLMAGKNNAEARDIFEKLIQADPNTPTAYYRLGLLARSEKKYDEALRNLTRALELNPSLMDVFSSLISVHAIRGQYDKALAAIDAHMKKRGDNTITAAIMLNLKGNILLSKQDRPGAVDAYKASIQNNPRYMTPYLTLAKLYGASKDWGETEKVYLDLVARRQDQALPYGLLGTLYERMGKPDQAEAMYLKALEVDPNHIPAVNNLAYLYAQQDRELNKALELARQAKERLGRIPAIMDTLGWVYYKKGLFESAAQEFLSCTEKEPSNPIFHYHLGLAYDKIGHSKKAKAALTAALKLSRDFTGADEAKAILNRL
ncbi:MAG: tetratricopeptide repeat protein, partial [Desulfobacterales bacterium]|nr:tetratricopeptide repeat protein [Desulfobacterales bacterium]